MQQKDMIYLGVIALLGYYAIKMTEGVGIAGQILTKNGTQSIQQGVTGAYNATGSGSYYSGAASTGYGSYGS